MVVPLQLQGLIGAWGLLAGSWHASIFLGGQELLCRGHTGIAAFDHLKRTYTRDNALPQHGDL